MDNLDFQETETTLAVQQIECTVHKLLTKAGKLSRISVFSSFHKTQYIDKFCKQKHIHDKVYVFLFVLNLDLLLLGMPIISCFGNSPKRIKRCYVM